MIFFNYIVKPLLSPPAANLFQTHLRGGLTETRGLIYLETTMVSVLYKEVEYKVKKHKYKKLEIMPLRIKNKSEHPVGE